MHKDAGRDRDRASWLRFIVDVRRDPSVPVRCVEVDNADHLYLASRSMIPTHNSTLGLDFARSAAIKHDMATVIFSLEMSRNEITMRLLSAEARVSLHHDAHRHDGRRRLDQAGAAGWARCPRRRCSSTTRPNMSMMEIRAKCRRLKQRHDLKLVVIDYLQLMTSRQARREPPAGGLGVLPCPQAARQGARGAGHRDLAAQPWPRAAHATRSRRCRDLRESGSIEQDADMVILLHREDAYEKESPRAGEADLIVAKHRNGPTATITWRSRATTGGSSTCRPRRRLACCRDARSSDYFGLLVQLPDLSAFGPGSTTGEPDLLPERAGRPSVATPSSPAEHSRACSRVRWRRPERKSHLDDEAAPGAWVGGERRVVGDGDRAHDRQAEAVMAVVGPVQPLERLEQPVDLVGRDDLAGVRDDEHHPAGARRTPTSTMPPGML